MKIYDGFFFMKDDEVINNPLVNKMLSDIYDKTIACDSVINS